MRLQKERDVVGQEAASLREKLELVQSQVAKATRDRELLLSETESSRERFDKVNQNLLKVQVRPLFPFIIKLIVLRFYWSSGTICHVT